MTSTVQMALSDAKSALLDMYGDRLAHVVLYGSQVRGEADEDSDVDVLVVLRDEFDLYTEIKRLVGLQHELLYRYEELLSFQPIAEKAFEDPTHPLMLNVRAEGIEL